MKKEVSPAIVVTVLVVLIGAVGGWIFYGMQPHTPAGVKYTPGVPPWMEKGAAKNYKPTPDYPQTAGAAQGAMTPGQPPAGPPGPPAINR